jgi:SAM-dependent methyltransferase
MVHTAASTTRWSAALISLDLVPNCVVVTTDTERRPVSRATNLAVLWGKALIPVDNGRLSAEFSLTFVVMDIVNSRVDTTVAHPARRYNYWLGGSENFAADRAAGDAVAAVYPSIRLSAIENRRFLRRAVTHLTRDLGIRQFLDIGSGIPGAGNTHEVARALAPSSRVVYVDNDPIVLEYGRTLVSGGAGAIAYLEADLRDPQRILAEASLRATLDLSRPVGLMLVAVLHFLGDEDRPYDLVQQLLAAMPAGSCLVLSHATADFMSPETAAAMDEAGARFGVPSRLRSRAEVARFFAGADLLPPGIVPPSEWHADEEPGPRPTLADPAMYAAVASLG